MVKSLTHVTVYTKEDCHLCEKVISVLRKLSAEDSFDIETRDINDDTEMFDRFRNVIPVVEINGKVRLAGAALSNRNSLEDVLRQALALQLNGSNHEILK